MNIIDLRKKLLQSSTDRREYVDRRKVSYPFGSAEWIEYMKMNNFVCPTEDRRKTIRREADRTASNEVSTTESKTIYQRFFLTPGEKKLLQDIYLSDLD